MTDDDSFIDIDEPDLPASVPSLRVLPAPVTRESPPSIEAPPQDGEVLDRGPTDTECESDSPTGCRSNACATRTTDMRWRDCPPAFVRRCW
ncbi:MAG: hypothetical protein WCG85_19955 [Polyangia bacterium]